MTLKLGIRKEDKNPWERRAPLTPHAVAALVASGVPVEVERFTRRAFLDEDYESAGAELVDELTDADLVLGIKEMPIRVFRPGRAYLFFSHTIKGQPYNMPMLAALMEQGCTLLDYELIKDDKDRRLVFFGRWAGVAGMIDTLWTLGRRLSRLGQQTVFADLDVAHMYPSLHEARAAIAAVGRRISQEGLPRELRPLVIGVTGYGNVSQGAQEILDILPHVEVAPSDLARFVSEHPDLSNKVVKVVYHEKHLVAPVAPTAAFDLAEYYVHPERYRSIFRPHLDLLSVLVNGIFWTERYPRLATRADLQALFAGPAAPRLKVVGDISCDIDGSLACTVRETNPGSPVYVYDPATHTAPAGFDGPGVAVMAVGNLPCELPMEASATFSHALEPFVPRLAALDFSKPLAAQELPPELERAVILWRGELVPRFAGLAQHLKPASPTDPANPRSPT